MFNRIVYSMDGNLEKLIYKKKLIPHKIISGERLIKGELYYSAFHGKSFKVLSVEYDESGMLVGAEVKYNDGNVCWICTDLDPSADYYLTLDKIGIKYMDIVNTNKTFTGAELRYWFFINNIDATNTKYGCFWRYIEQYNDQSISDRFTYRLTADFVDDRYTNARIYRINTDHNTTIPNSEYWERLRKRDRIAEKNKMRRRH